MIYFIKLFESLMLEITSQKNFSYSLFPPSISMKFTGENFFKENSFIKNLRWLKSHPFKRKISNLTR